VREAIPLERPVAPSARGWCTTAVSERSTARLVALRRARRTLMSSSDDFVRLARWRWRGARWCVSQNRCVVPAIRARQRSHPPGTPDRRFEPAGRMRPRSVTSLTRRRSTRRTRREGSTSGSVLSGGRGSPGWARRMLVRGPEPLCRPGDSGETAISSARDTESLCRLDGLSETALRGPAASPASRGESMSSFPSPGLPSKTEAGRCGTPVRPPLSPQRTVASTQ
jgi:hypothetical protein